MTFNIPAKKTLLAIIAIIAVAVFGIIFKFLSPPKEIIISENASSAETNIDINNNTNNIKDSQPILAYITGEVNNPGVYELKEGDRVADIVRMAGGFTEEADTVNVNLAKKIRDEDNVHIAKIGDPAPAGESKLININTASVSELTALPGIGEVKGQNIVTHRESYGKFKSIEELKNVTGIGDKTFEGLKDLIAID